MKGRGGANPATLPDALVLLAFLQANSIRFYNDVTEYYVDSFSIDILYNTTKQGFLRV